MRLLRCVSPLYGAFKVRPPGSGAREIIGTSFLQLQGSRAIFSKSQDPFRVYSRL